MSMTLQQYETARAVLEQKIQEANERERKHRDKAHAEYQVECKRWSTRMGNMRAQKKELDKKYRQDKQYIHGLYRAEKQNLNLQIHNLKMEYLTVNGIESKENSKKYPHAESSITDKEE